MLILRFKQTNFNGQIAHERSDHHVDRYRATGRCKWARDNGLAHLGWLRG